MKHSVKTILLSFVYLFVITGCSPNEEKNSKQKPGHLRPVIKADRGKLLFEEKCNACHGADGTAGIANAANLQTSRLDSASVIGTIINGKKSMPAFKGQLNNEEAEKLRMYVISLRN